MINGFLQKMRSVWLWDRVTQLSARGKFREALDAVRFADERLKSHVSWRIFEVQQLGLLRNDVGTLEAAQSVIEELTAKKNLTANDRYFLAFAQWYGQVAFRELHSSQAVPDNLKFDLASVVLADVSRTWKRVFPMPIHSEWKGSSPSQQSA